jgi:hypothetical protein
MHEIASIAEMKRLYGAVFDIDAAIKVDAPGMEIGGQHKYGFNILLDFKPGESPFGLRVRNSFAGTWPTRTMRRSAPGMQEFLSQDSSPNRSRPYRHPG